MSLLPFLTFLAGRRGGKAGPFAAAEQVTAQSLRPDLPYMCLRKQPARSQSERHWDNHPAVL